MAPKGRVSAHLHFQSLWKLVEEEKKRSEGGKIKNEKKPLELSSFEKYHIAKKKKETKQKKKAIAEIKKWKKQGKQPDIRMAMGAYVKE